MQFVKKGLLVFLFVSFSQIISAEIYKWVDDDGVTHYSDSPHLGSEEVNLPDIGVYKPKASKNRSKIKENGAPKKVGNAVLGYQSLLIKSPQNEESVRDNEGIVKVTVDIAPTLRKGDLVQLYLDSRKIGPPQDDLTFILNNVDRGEHQLSAEVVDKQGKAIMKSPSVTFFMLRILVPKNRPS